MLWKFQIIMIKSRTYLLKLQKLFKTTSQIFFDFDCMSLYLHLHLLDPLPTSLRPPWTTCLHPPFLWPDNPLFPPPPSPSTARRPRCLTCQSGTASLRKKNRHLYLLLRGIRRGSWLTWKCRFLTTKGLDNSTVFYCILLLHSKCMETECYTKMAKLNPQFSNHGSSCMQKCSPKLHIYA